MAHQAQFHNKLFFSFTASCLILLQCKQNKQHASFNLNTINAATVAIQTKQGITYINNNPATAFIFQLYHNGDTAFTGTYINGKEDGIFNYWFENKQIKETRNFKNGRQAGEAKGWWPNGQQKFSYHFFNDVYEGNVKEWGSSGTLYRVMHYKNGQEEGGQKLWYDNGQLRSNYVIKDGRRYGLLGTKNCINVSDSIFK